MKTNHLGLLKRGEEDIPKRDYVYYLALAHTRIKVGPNFFIFDYF